MGRLPLKQKLSTLNHEFLTPRRLKTLTNLELRHLHNHYITRFFFPPNSVSAEGIQRRRQMLNEMRGAVDRYLSNQDGAALMKDMFCIVFALQSANPAAFLYGAKIHTSYHVFKPHQSSVG